MFVTFVGNPQERNYIQEFVQYLLKLARFFYQRNYVPTHQENFGEPRTLIPHKLIQNDSTVLHAFKELYALSNPFLNKNAGFDSKNGLFLGFGLVPSPS